MEKTNENQITIFQNEEFGKVRTVIIDGEPWFVGKDVAEALEYNEPHKAINRHVSEDDRTKHPVIDSTGREQEAWIINESGLYALIFGSKLDSAKRFKRWVTSEVLPSIRKTGMYAQPLQLTTSEKIKLLATGIDEINERVGVMENRITAIEKSLDVLGSSENYAKLKSLKTKIKERAYQLVGDNEYYKEIWIGYFISGNYSVIKGYFNIASINQLPAEDYEDAMVIATTWSPSWAYLKNRIDDMWIKFHKGKLSDKKLYALLHYIYDTKNGEINPF